MIRSCAISPNALVYLRELEARRDTIDSISARAR